MKMKLMALTEHQGWWIVEEIVRPTLVTLDKFMGQGVV